MEWREILSWKTSFLFSHSISSTVMEQRLQKKTKCGSGFHDEGQRRRTICWNLFSSSQVWKWNKSEWTPCSFRSLVRHNKMDPVVLCIVFLHGLFGGFGILERKQLKGTLQCGTREASKQVLSVSVSGSVGRSVPPHLNYRLNYTTTTEWIVRKLSTDSDAGGWIQQTLEISWWVSSTTTTRFVILREIGWSWNLNPSTPLLAPSSGQNYHLSKYLQHLQHSHQPPLNLSNAN